MVLDRYTLLAALCALTLVATVRVALGGLDWRGGPAALRWLTRPAWLLPLILLGYLALGKILTGSLSPWPPAAYAAYAEYSVWAGVAAFALVLATDIWLLWAPAMVLGHFMPAPARGKLVYVHALNLLAGAVVIGPALAR